MKKMQLIVAFALFWACSKKDDAEVVPPPPAEAVVQTLDFNLNFYNQDVTNLRVGQEILVKVSEIKDENNTPEVVYRLVSIGEDATRHQLLKKDYKIKAGNDFVEALEITDPEQITLFKIVPQVPGTFQLRFQLMKYNKAENKFVGEPAFKELVFSAVKIHFHFPKKQIKNSTMFRPSEHRRWFRFSIDDGEREYDSYLSNYTSAERYEYVTEYQGSNPFSGTFRVQEIYDFRAPKDSESWAVNPGRPPFAQTLNIKVIQHLKNGTKNIIEYRDVPLEYVPGT